MTLLLILPLPNSIASDGDLIHLIETLFIDLARSLITIGDMHTLAPIDNGSRDHLKRSIISSSFILSLLAVEFSPELLAFAVRRADSHQQRLRALADRRTCARVARLYRTLSLVHGALVDGRAIRKRALFYADVALFRAQAASDAALLDCAALLQVPPARLGVHASPRGLVRGALLLNGSDCRQLAHLIPAAGESLQIQVDADVQFILIIEKEVRRLDFIGSMLARLTNPLRLHFKL